VRAIASVGRFAKIAVEAEDVADRKTRLLNARLAAEDVGALDDMGMLGALDRGAGRHGGDYGGFLVRTRLEYLGSAYHQTRRPGSDYSLTVQSSSVWNKPKAALSV
jgi:hypothetical protein